MALARALVIAVGLGVAAHGVARAQSAAHSSSPPAASCQRSAGVAAAYVRCSLWLEDDYLILGKPGEPVAHADGMRPVALSRFVVGDSARRYALEYERDAGRALWLELVAGVMILKASVSVVTTPRCACASFFNQHPCPAAERMVYAGMAVDLASYLFKWRAEEEGSLALAWHNRALSR
jgi:hypothetical protein